LHRGGRPLCRVINPLELLGDEPDLLLGAQVLQVCERDAQPAESLRRGLALLVCTSERFL